jgi:hypothetical protein
VEKKGKVDNGSAKDGAGSEEKKNRKPRRRRNAKGTGRNRRRVRTVVDD